MPNPFATKSAALTLPPLILHPFSGQSTPSEAVGNSRAALMLAGLIPHDGSDEQELQRRVLSGRCAELRMLFFVGKDVLRWIEQCMELTARLPQDEEVPFQPQSFAEFLTAQPPEVVREKLLGWGVADHAAIFARAIGLHAVFAVPPSIEMLSVDFLMDYHRYTDSLFKRYMESCPHRRISCPEFSFELYASGEYSRLLASEWSE
jgi:hypothetical protein